MEKKLEENSEEKAEETVIYGSLYEALYAGFVTLDEVLQYLLKTPPEDEFQRRRMCIAYRIICIYGKNQFINGKHFICLTDNSDYISIYCLSFPSLTLETEDAKTNCEITRKVQSVIPNFINKNDNTRFFYVLCETTNINFTFKKEDNILIACTRSLKNIDKIMEDDFCILASDYLNVLELLPKKKYVSGLINRCKYLKDCSPLYWKIVAYPLYYNFVKKHFSLAEGFNKELILSYHSCFPDLFSEKTLNKSELAFFLSSLNREICSYYLGFPIHKYIPNSLVLNSSIDKLEEIGIEKYCSQVLKNKNKSNIANPENVELDKIESFNTFDIVSYYDENNHLFRFTRCEFEKLLKDEKNFYTGEKLPFFVIEKIRCRNNISKRYNLPKSQPLHELLENDKEEKEEQEEQEDDQSDTEIVPDHEEEIYVFARVLDRETDEIRVLNFAIPIYFDDTEIDEFIEEIVEERDMEYLGRIECSCPSCGIEPE